MTRVHHDATLALYEQLELHSEKMITAASSHDWPQLEALEHGCLVLISQLSEALQRQRLSPAQQGIKGRIMVRILRNDARVRQLTGCAAGAALTWPETAPKTLH